jgi:hypothetical protein
MLHRARQIKRRKSIVDVLTLTICRLRAAAIRSPDSLADYKYEITQRRWGSPYDNLGLPTTVPISHHIRDAVR